MVVKEEMIQHVNVSVVYYLFIVLLLLVIIVVVVVVVVVVDCFFFECNCLSFKNYFFQLLNVEVIITLLCGINNLTYSISGYNIPLLLLLPKCNRWRVTFVCL